LYCSPKVGLNAVLSVNDPSAYALCLTDADLQYRMLLILLAYCAAMYHGLAIDVRRQKLYYTDQAPPAGQLGELSTDITGHRVLFRIVRSMPRAVVIDEVNRSFS